MSVVDKVLRIMIYVLAVGMVIVGLYAIVKILGFNLEFEFLIPFIALVFSLLLTLAIKISRIQDLVEKKSYVEKIFMN